MTYEPVIPVISFHAEKAGPALLVFGAVHGNEKCGTRAIHRIIASLEKGELELEKGSVTFVPVANPLAYKKNIRFVEENLNRIFRRTRNPKSAEARMANILSRLVDECDVFLDIHSITAEGQPFVYLDYPTKRNRAFARALNVKTAIVGWPQLYKKFGSKHVSFDTARYAAGQGKDGILIECGQHMDPSSEAVAHTAILNALRHYRLIAGKAKTQTCTEIRMFAGYFRQSADDRLAKNWKHLDKVKKGDILIHPARGPVIKAAQNATIIMPKATAGVGQDWLYLGKR